MMHLRMLVGTVALVTTLAVGAGTATALPARTTSLWFNWNMPAADLVNPEQPDPAEPDGVDAAPPEPVPPAPEPAPPAPQAEPEPSEPKPPPAPSRPIYRLPTTAKEVVLTFDDGPSAYTAQILAILQETEVKATFFWVGAKVPLAGEVVAQGHQLGSHTLTHARLTNLSGPALLAELTGSKEALEAAGKEALHLFRPPYGAYNNDILQAAEGLGLATILWDVDSRDWALQENPEQIITNVMGQVKPGSIILLHERKQTVAVLPQLIQSLKEAGYTFRLVPTGVPAAGAE